MSASSSQKPNEPPTPAPPGPEDGGAAPLAEGSTGNAPVRAGDEAAKKSAPRKPRRVDRLIGTRLAEKYKILKKIGEGGMGSVYIATQEPIDRKVAVKVLLAKLAEDDIAVRRFEQEARAISKMQHPNTVTIYDYGQVTAEDGTERLYIVMEYLKGSTLTQVLRKEGALPGPRASRIVRQVCASLADAHGAGIIHRDLKPDNIFLSELGGEKDWVKVLDFGVAKLADSESAGTLTQTGMIFGTPKYMSPEQAEGKPIDYRADIYALGVVLYELLTGKPPFVADTPVGLLLKHISEPPKALSEAAAERDVDPRLEAIVLRALEKHPDRRQQQVTELAAELEQYERAVTGPQAIPTDVGGLAPGFGPTTGRSGWPTEVVPGTSPGQPVTPSGLMPPDQVPPDLSAGVPPGGASDPSAGAAAGTSAGTARATALEGAGLTAPVPQGPPVDTVGNGASGSLPRPRPRRGGWIAAIAVLAVAGAGLGIYLRKQSAPAPTVEPIEEVALVTPPALPSATESPAAEAQSPEEGAGQARPSAEKPSAPAGEAPGQAQPSGEEPGETEPSGASRSRPESHSPGGEGRSRSKAPSRAASPGPERPGRSPSRPRRRAEPSAARPPAEPEARRPPTVPFRLRSSPSEARVSLGGKQVGVTPVEIRVPRGEARLTFVFEKRGYNPIEKVASAADGELTARLERRRRPRPSARPARDEKTCPDGSEPPCRGEDSPLRLRVDDLK